VQGILELDDLAVDAFLEWRASGAAIDSHLGDQLVPILATAPAASRLTVPELTSHLKTVAWVVDQFLPARVKVLEGAPSSIEIETTAIDREHLDAALA
jgi:RNA 3'-terminal phosphate cyclase